MEKEKSKFNYCPKCGYKLTDHFNFCPNCGYSLYTIREEEKEYYITDYLLSFLDYLNQQIVDAKKNAIIQNLLVDYYLEIENEIRLLFVLDKRLLDNLDKVIDVIVYLLREKKKSVSIVLISKEKEISEIENELKYIMDKLSLVLDKVDIELYVYKGYVRQEPLD
ncbi:hypothetical protein SJAV_27680 [Sulfurisphaera javensis]|uniref:Zinc-ribbon domain-containing protein n=1 Tax=Sulfurisphaera javensis TaxID=2049879 RepID=A0AAT9GVB6_9CREN